MQPIARRKVLYVHKLGFILGLAASYYLLQKRSQVKVEVPRPAMSPLVQICISVTFINYSWLLRWLGKFLYFDLKFLSKSTLSPKIKDNGPELKKILYMTLISAFNRILLIFTKSGINTKLNCSWGDMTNLVQDGTCFLSFLSPPTNFPKQWHVNLGVPKLIQSAYVRGPIDATLIKYSWQRAPITWMSNFFYFHAKILSN